MSNNNKATESVEGVEVTGRDRVDLLRERMVTNGDRLAMVPLVMAKVKVGAAVKSATEGRALKEFGDHGLMSNVCSGEKVPDYLARIYMDPRARRKFALSLLRGDTRVRVTTTVTLEDEEGVA